MEFEARVAHNVISLCCGCNPPRELHYDRCKIAQFWCCRGKSGGVVAVEFCAKFLANLEA